MAIQRPTGKYLNPGSDTNKMNKALQKPKITIVSSSDKTYMENQRLEKMKNARTTGGINNPQVQPVYRNQNGVTGTGTSSGTQTKKYSDLPKSTKISGSAKATTTPSAAKVNRATKGGKEFIKRAGSK